MVVTGASESTSPPDSSGTGSSDTGAELVFTEVLSTGGSVTTADLVGGSLNDSVSD